MAKKKANYRTSIIRILLGQQRGFCALCEKALPLDDAEIDHIHPQALGGTDEPDNLQAVHSICNKRKGNSVSDRYAADEGFGLRELKECPFYNHYIETMKTNRVKQAPVDHVAAEGLRRLMFVCDKPPGMRLAMGMQTWFWESENWHKAFEVPLPKGDMEPRPGIGVGIHFFRADGMERTPSVVVGRMSEPDYSGMLEIVAIVISEKNDHAVVGIDVGKTRESGKIQMLVYPVDERFPDNKMLKDLLIKMTVFLEYKVVDMEQVKAPRGFRRRLKKGSPQEADMNRTSINVVRWRKFERRTDGNGNPIGGKDFCWPVVGHIRRQYYPSTGKHHPIWIEGHVKGNLNAPMKKKSLTINIVDR